MTSSILCELTDYFITDEAPPNEDDSILHIMKKTKIGIIGCGNISSAYFGTNAKYSFFDIAACADLNLDAAKQKAIEWNIQKACSVEELVTDPEIEFVINLTIPQAHGPIMLQSLENGKSVYTEKPFTVTREEAQKVIDLAARKGLRVGSAPDTFLGGAHQTCRKLIDDGAIGDIVGSTAFMVCRGHEMWHSSPEFFYKKGGGPMFDMGPYYLTDLVQLLGPVETVAAFTKTTFAHRTITSQPLSGKVVDVEIPTHIAGNFQFQNGAIGTMIMSFDVWDHNLPILEIYGTEGTLYVPDPNKFGGEVKIKRGGGEIENVSLTHVANEGARGIGMADMILAMRQGREHRCNEKLAYHVLDLMHCFHDSYEKKQFINVESSCERPAALPTGLSEGELH